MEEKLFRSKVSWFNFICCLLVVWNHAGNSELFGVGSSPADPLYRFEYITVPSAVEINIPCFMMLSAYLFYRGFSWVKLTEKWKRRIKTLLIPYLLWNTLYYLGFLLAGQLPILNSIIGKGEIVFNLQNALNAIIKFAYNPVFWFMYQLILLVILAPVLYLVLKRWWSGLLFLCLLWIGMFQGTALPELNLDALIYYSTAAFFALHGRKSMEHSWTFKRFLFGAVIVSFGIVLRFGYLEVAGIPGLVYYRLSVPIGLWLMVNEQWLGRVRPWMTCTFFIFAVHFIPVRFINKAAALMLPGNAAVACLLFLAMPVLTIIICYQPVRLMRKYTPRLWGLMNGNRA